MRSSRNQATPSVAGATSARARVEQQLGHEDAAIDALRQALVAHYAARLHAHAVAGDSEARSRVRRVARRSRFESLVAH